MHRLLLTTPPGKAILFGMAVLTTMPGDSGAASATLALIPPASFSAILCVAIFVLAYVAVLFEEITHMEKSKPVMLGAGAIWTVIALTLHRHGADHDALRAAVDQNLNSYASLMMFLLTSVTYTAALQDRQVFDALRARLVQFGLSSRGFFWVIGILSFLLAGVANNLATALIAGSIILAVGGNNPRFVVLACVNAVNAANAGGLFSPFGNITTLMIWQSGHLGTFDFLQLFLPAVACFFIPALIMNFYLPTGQPWAVQEDIRVKHGGWLIVFLGALAIVMTVAFDRILGLPAFLGMTTGLSLLLMSGWLISKAGKNRDADFDILHLVSHAEWDTLLFFFGVIFCVGGLAFLGYIDIGAHALYSHLGPTVTNIALGIPSAVVDNIPIVYALLNMHQDMNQFQWLLATLTTGIGGSLLSIGSAAGVALMGMAREQYTFSSHLKWTPVLLLGYAGAILTHFWLNG